MKIDTVDLIQETQFSPIYFKSFSPAFFQVRLPVLLIVPILGRKSNKQKRLILILFPAKMKEDEKKVWAHLTNFF